ncbi:MAG: tetratricopeptide repeat protein [Alphaproteobacteria bacterium]|nr:tetratricopeptide repeat protein [Alphaproteobacteria bacterium]
MTTTAETLHAEGLDLWRSGNLGAAAERIGSAIAAAPGIAAYRNSLGAIFASAGDTARGAALFRSALAIEPAEGSAWLNLGHTLRGHGEAEARRAYERAVAIDPISISARTTLVDFVAHTLNNRGMAHFQRGEVGDALAAFERALASAPFHVSVLANSALVLQRLGRSEEARARYARALVIDPALAEGHSNLASLDQSEIDHASALARHRRAVAIKPDPGLHSSLIFALCCAETTNNEAVYAEARRWERLLAQPAYAAIRPLQVDRSPDRRLRLGWCSADFSNHPVGRNVVGLFERLDRDAFASVIYGDLKQPDPVTSRFLAAAEGWREIRGIADADVADIIRRDRIDILVMAAGHTTDNRLGIAARKPAPLQVSFHDITTSGLAVMDGWLTDAALHPETTTEKFTERLIRLPCFYLHQPPADAPDPAPKTSTGITFGSMNNPHKYNGAVFGAWACILRAVPDSRLLLKYSRAYESPRLRRIVTDAFASEGVAAERLHFVGGLIPPREHLAVLQQVDIALDPFPFNGSTTSFEALWMGIPLVTLAGDRFLARVGASCLAQIGLEDLIAEDIDGYVARAVALAQDRERLARLRQTLRARVAASPLCDAEAHARAFETAMRSLWREWCA